MGRRAPEPNEEYLAEHAKHRAVYDEPAPTVIEGDVKPVEDDERAVYRVIGRHAVFGAKTGGELELTARQAAPLVEAGHIELAVAEEVSEAADAESDDTGHLPEVTESE